LISKAGIHWSNGLRVNAVSLDQRLLQLASLFLLIAFFPPKLALADVPPHQVKEVDHLIEYIRNTPCLLERNDKKYTGKEVIKHILKKYDYFRDEIKSTEDFIKYSASKSELSGKLYVAYCEGRKPVEGNTWLMGELTNYRKNNK
jgi:hypothetical protein